MNLKHLLESKVDNKVFNPKSNRLRIEQYFYSFKPITVDVWYNLRENIKENVDPVIEINIKEVVMVRTIKSIKKSIKILILNCFK